MSKEAIKKYLFKIFTRDVDLDKKSIFFLFFSFLSITFIVEFFILKYFINTEVITEAGRALEIQPILALLVSSIIFLISGLIIDKIKNKTKFYLVNLLLCIIALFLTNFPFPVIEFISFLIIFITIPQIIIVCFSTLVHETNILNRGRLTAIILICSYLISLLGLTFIIYEELFIFFCIIQAFLLIIIFWYSRNYEYIETEDRLESDKKYFQIILEKHFFRYAVGLAFLSGLLGGLCYTTLNYFKTYEINIITFSIISFFYIIAAGWFFDNVGRKNTLVIGILIVSFFYISHGSFYLPSVEYVFGIPIKFHISIHYAFTFLPLILAIIIISGDFSTERGNLKYRARINGIFISLMSFGIAIGYLLYRLIFNLYNTIPEFETLVPNLPNLLNAFVIVIILVWMMVGKDILISKEREWAKTIKNLFVVSKSGVCLYNHRFESKKTINDESKTPEYDEDLISGALSGIITIISEITQSKQKLRKIDKEGNYLLFSYGKFHTAALITSMDLPVLFKKLDDFSREFEHEFSKELKSFQGNVRNFLQTKLLVKKYFKQKYF